jgi:hypothetical protein
MHAWDVFLVDDRQMKKEIDREIIAFRERKTEGGRKMRSKNKIVLHASSQQ